MTETANARNSAAPALVFILPTRGSESYRGKFPTRPRAVSGGETGTHVELNNGVRLWAYRDSALPLPGLRDDCAAVLEAARPMTAEQYAELQRAADLLRTRANFAGRGPRLDVENRVHAILRALVDSAEEPATGAETISESPAPLRLRGFADKAARRAAAHAERGEIMAALGPVSPEEKAARDSSAFIESPAAPVQTIDMTPTWRGILPVFLALLENGTAEGRRTAREELGRMADLADSLVAARRDLSAVSPEPEAGRVAFGSPEAAAMARAAELEGAALREAPEAAETAPSVSPAMARNLGVQSCACGLQRAANPFERDSAAWEAWEDGFSAAVADWKADLRARVADDFGDAAADEI